MRSWTTFSRRARTGGLCAAAALAVGSCAAPQDEDWGEPPAMLGTPLGSPVSTFRDLLSPHGEWFETPSVGWVWRPHASVVGADFVPYATGGRWMESDRGWTFETDWAWGPSVFHFGRWFHIPESGWVWWPDDEWAPAWVDWRWGGGFVGWAPTPPPTTAKPSWTFVKVEDLVKPDVARFVVPPDRAEEVLARTEPVGERVTGRNGQWSRGPAFADVERATGQPPPRARESLPPTGQPPLASEDTGATDARE